MDYVAYVTDADLSVNLQSTALLVNFTTLIATDSVPDVFTFTNIVNAELSTNYTSVITVSGIDTGSIISVTGGEYKIGTGNYTSATGVVYNGDIITASGTSSSSYSTANSEVVTIGGVSETYSITTKAQSNG